MRATPPGDLDGMNPHANTFANHTQRYKESSTGYRISQAKLFVFLHLPLTYKIII